MGQGEIQHRVRTAGIFVLAVVLTAGLAVGLQYYFSRATAIDSSLARYKQTARGTSEYLGFVDSKTAEMTRILSRYPDLVSAGVIHADSQGIFAEIMRSNPLLYAIYIGMEDGTFYELVNLQTNETVRRQLRASPEDRWVVITMEGAGENRLRTFSYLREDMATRVTRSENSAYQPNTRNWFVQADESKVVKTGPYQFQHLQAPGQTYSIRIPGSNAVLALDIALSSISAYLANQVQIQQGEVFIFQGSGEIIASNQDVLQTSSLEHLSVQLNDTEKAYLASRGPVRISNELDWSPIDYTVAGEPRGFAIDLVKQIGARTGIRFEFVNGHTWAELVDLFRTGDLDVLQPIFQDAQHKGLGLFSKPILQLPYAVLTKPGRSPVTSLTDLHGHTVSIPRGWTILKILQTNYPQITILETPTAREAVAAVERGEVYATIDSAIALHYIVEQYFIDGVQFHEQVDFSQAGLPDELHMLVQNDDAALLSIINKGLAAITPDQKRQLASTWFRGLQQTNLIQHPAVVPYKEVLDAVAAKQLDTLVEVGLNGSSYFMYVTQLGKVNTRGEYFALVIPSDNVLGNSVQKAQLTALIIAVSLLLIPILGFLGLTSWTRLR